MTLALFLGSTLVVLWTAILASGEKFPVIVNLSTSVAYHFVIVPASTSVKNLFSSFLTLWPGSHNLFFNWRFYFSRSYFFVFHAFTLIFLFVLSKASFIWFKRIRTVTLLLPLSTPLIVFSLFCIVSPLNMLCISYFYGFAVVARFLTHRRHLAEKWSETCPDGSTWFHFVVDPYLRKTNQIFQSFSVRSTVRSPPYSLTSSSSSFKLFLCTTGLLRSPLFCSLRAGVHWCFFLVIEV